VQHVKRHRTAVIIDRYPLWLDAVAQVMARSDVEVVGRTTSPDHVIDLILEHHPDVVVTEIDLGEPEIDPEGWIERIRGAVPGLKVIILSTCDDVGHIDAALAAGAAAYVVKTAHADDFAAAVRQAFTHSIYFSTVGVSASPSPARAGVDDTRGLTRRELEILQLVAEGHTNAQLAKMLWVTEQTVKFHLSNIYRKLDVANRTEASRWAQVQGLLPDPAASHANAI
jgi:DNA-binding NarL/FixJ family response regulator